MREEVKLRQNKHISLNPRRAKKIFPAVKPVSVAGRPKNEACFRQPELRREVPKLAQAVRETSQFNLADKTEVGCLDSLRGVVGGFFSRR